MLVSIIIPCYNSEHTIGKVVELAIQEFEKLENYECEFVCGSWIYGPFLRDTDPDRRFYGSDDSCGGSSAVFP